MVERQALRRVDAGDLDDGRGRRLGRALMQLEDTFDELIEHFGVVAQRRLPALDLDARSAPRHPRPTADAAPTRRTHDFAVTRAPRPSSLADVLDIILDKGIVIDAYVRVSLVGIELLTSTPAS